MTRIFTSLAATAVLSFTGLAFHGSAAAANRTFAPEGPHTTFAPVVIEWFSVASPRIGQRAIVYARFVNNNKPVSGARLSATVLLGRRSLMVVGGGATNGRGVAAVHFSVPATARGKTMQVAVKLTYKGRAYVGRDAVRVRA